MKKILPALLTCVIFYISQGYADNGIYFTGEGGIATHSGLPSATDVGATSLSTDYLPNAFRASVGYNHDLTPSFGFGLNIGAGEFAKTTYTYPDGSTQAVKSEIFDIVLTGTFHLPRKIDLFIKAGADRQSLLINGDNPYPTQICPEVAFGGAYNFSHFIATTATYTRVIHDASTTFTNTPSVNIVMIGLRYTFYSA